MQVSFAVDLLCCWLDSVMVIGQEDLSLHFVSLLLSSTYTHHITDIDGCRSFQEKKS